jgi:hypothetical protein
MQKAKKNRLAVAAAAFLLMLVLFTGWYAVAANYDYPALSGVYVLNQNAEKCVLDLHSDRTFTEELVRSGNVQRATGTWHRYGESHVSFSQEFLTLAGQELNASGEPHGEFGKRLGLFPILTLAPLPNGPKLHKHFFARPTI